MNGKYQFNTKLFVSAALLCFIVACQPPEKPNTVVSYRVQAQKHQNNLYFGGTIQPQQTYPVSSPVDGIIKKQHFHYGQFVQKGQLLFEIHSESLNKSYTQALQTYLTDKDKLTAAQAQMASSKELLALGIIPRSRYLADKSGYSHARIRYQQSRLNLEKVIDQTQEKSLNLERLNINNFSAIDRALNTHNNHLLIKAPASGLALRSQSGSGRDTTATTPGKIVKAAETLVSIGDMRGVAVTVYANEIDVKKISPGLKTVMTIDALSPLKLPGTIDDVSAQADVSQGSKLPRFAVTVIVNQIPKRARGQLRVGMTAKIKLTLPPSQKLTIPIAALRHHHGRDWVSRRNQTGAVEETAVETGVSQAGLIEVIAGLHAGDVIQYPEQLA